VEAALRSNASGILLAWAQRLEIELPVALVEAVQKRGPTRDWKSLYDESEAAHLEKEKSWAAVDASKDRLIAAKHRIAAVLETRVRELETQRKTPSSEKPLSTRERESLLKLVIGMACGGYGYDSTARRSEQTAAIADDLLRAGVPLDADTVRKWLRGGLAVSLWRQKFSRFASARLLTPKRTSDRHRLSRHAIMYK
jgi:hypothetical protein